MPDRIHFTVKTEKNNLKSCVNTKINVRNKRISKNGTLFVVNKQLTGIVKKWNSISGNLQQTFIKTIFN